MTFTPSPSPPHPTITPEMVQWLANGRRGLSSEVVFSWLTGVVCWKSLHPDRTTFHPLDAGDFERCIMLMNQCPTLRPCIPALAELSPIWAGFVSAWTMLEVLLEHGERSRVNLLIDDIIKVNRT